MPTVADIDSLPAAQATAFAAVLDDAMATVSRGEKTPGYERALAVLNDTIPPYWNWTAEQIGIDKFAVGGITDVTGKYTGPPILLKVLRGVSMSDL